MKALSLIQPYATLIALGYKLHETRSFKTNHRGPLLIHASAGKPKWAREVCEQNEIIQDILSRHGLTFDTLPRGVLLASCTVEGVYHIKKNFTEYISVQDEACGDYTPGRYAWRLEDVKVLPEPIPAKGSLGLWDAAKYMPGYQSSMILIRSYEFKHGLLHLERGVAEGMSNEEVADHYGFGKGDLLSVRDGEMPERQFFALQDFRDM